MFLLQFRFFDRAGHRWFTALISIKHSMEVLDGSEARSTALAGMVTKILRAVERSAVVLAGESAHSFRERLAAARAGLTPRAAPDLMEQSGTTVEQELDGFTRELATMMGTKDSQYKEVVRLVAEAATTLAE